MGRSNIAIFNAIRYKYEMHNMQDMEYFYYAIFKDTTNSFLTLNFYIALFNAFNHSNISNVPLHHMKE